MCENYFFNILVNQIILIFIQKFITKKSKKKFAQLGQEYSKQKTSKLIQLANYGRVNTQQGAMQQQKSYLFEFINAVGGGYAVGLMAGGGLGFMTGFLKYSGMTSERISSGIVHLKYVGADYGNLFAKFNGVFMTYRYGLQNYCQFDDIVSIFLSFPLTATTLSLRQGVKQALANGVRSSIFAVVIFGYIGYTSYSK
ncbi:Tim17/tim22/tim23/pmp24 family protein (macronuclear) [Tetrahymena thermophila SB210]|uniref:Tim17/tim22/tim23/pmp24 family protein n=1 Tax=Tetrahymena thermophila (strain SB210) TaxID=312017 RepID=I7LV52_TETTS|nr:Tim17/tim22/tim23/pmp24 family protein [Tetrahymena thermophila SB210]EAR97226.2 Tim17/tim22/tim23/pmp24 family protein [Tetrahymena thermophila SB210]|eukprot:XP_001017471.2 Tim17/tim22/tim23/pmp24 family protein [Tetrahymena thermophila SB210]